MTLLAGSTNSDNAIQSFKVGNWRIYAQLTLEQSTEYDENMKKIKDELNRKAYLEMVGSSLFPQDEQKRKRKSVYKETKDELQVITSVLFSMVAVATAIWWAGGTMNPTYVGDSNAVIIYTYLVMRRKHYWRCLVLSQLQ